MHTLVIPMIVASSSSFHLTRTLFFGRLTFFICLFTLKTGTVTPNVALFLTVIANHAIDEGSA